MALCLGVHVTSNVIRTIVVQRRPNRMLIYVKYYVTRDVIVIWAIPAETAGNGKDNV